jgi:hypothetical protein
MRFKLLTALLLLVLAAPAQSINESVDTTQAIPKFGANRRFHRDAYLGLGVITGPQQAGAYTNWWSSSLAFGLRGKLKLWSWESLVLDLGYRYDRFSLNQKKVKRLPVDQLAHQRERISVHNLSTTFCNRISLGKHGDVLGRFLDVGIYGDLVFRTTNVYLDQYYDSNSEMANRFRIKSRLSRLPYIQPANYGLVVRLGSNNSSFFGMWRMNDLVKDSADRNYPDLPRLVVGIQISGFRFIHW